MGPSGQSRAHPKLADLGAEMPVTPSSLPKPSRPVPTAAHRSLQAPVHSTSPQGFRIRIRLTIWPW